MKQRITAKRLREVLDYDRLTGIFTWRVTLCSRAIAGRETSPALHQGRRKISVDGTIYLAARLAWLHAKGSWPTAVVDHLNGDKGDDRIDNLRDVTQKVNRENQHVPSKRGSTGLLGAWPCSRGGRFYTCIRVDGVRKYLGTFDKVEEAHAVYIEAKRRLHEGCTI